jgi:hypothetical protein
MDRRKVQGKKNDGKQIVGFRPGWMSHADVIPGASIGISAPLDSKRRRTILCMELRSVLQPRMEKY